MIIFDFETTGLDLPLDANDAKQPEVIEFAGIKIDLTKEGNPEIARLEFLCKPRGSISPEITELTGLADADVEHEESFAGHVMELNDFFLGETHLAAHNIAFDMKMFYMELSRLGMVTRFPWPANQICTAELSEQIYGKRKKLTDLYKILFEKEFESSHRAMADVEALTNIVRNYIQSREIVI